MIRTPWNKEREVFDYDFIATSHSDYDMQVECNIKNRTFSYLYEKSVAVLKKKQNITVKGNPDDIKEFDIIPQYYNMLLTAYNTIIRKIEKQLKEDGIHLKQIYVKKATFKKEKNWRVKTIFTGLYIKK